MTLEPKAASALVECAVRVSPTLARLIRKCAILEAGGGSPQNALITVAGFKVGEIETQRREARHCLEELAQVQEREQRLLRALDHAKATIAQRDNDLRMTRQAYAKAQEGEKEFRGTLESLKVQIAEMQLTIDAQRNDLTRSVSTKGLDAPTVAALSIFKDLVHRGEDIKAAALASVGNSAPAVEAALAKQECREIQALEALLARPTLRRRIVLWLLRVDTQNRAR